MACSLSPAKDNVDSTEPSPGVNIYPERQLISPATDNVDSPEPSRGFNIIQSGSQLRGLYQRTRRDWPARRTYGILDTHFPL